MVKRKIKRGDGKALFGVGICFVGVSVVFMTNVNRALGIAFLVLGIVYMIRGRRKR